MSNQDLTDLTQGARFDEGKPPMDLVPMAAMRAIAQVLGKGAEKYTKFNWLKGMKHTQLWASCMRHLAAWLDGEDIDKESGMPHIWHALTNLAMLADHLEHGRGEDDRYKHTLEGWKKEQEAKTDTSTLVEDMLKAAKEMKQEQAKEFEPKWAPNVPPQPQVPADKKNCANCDHVMYCSGPEPGEDSCEKFRHATRGCRNCAFEGTCSGQGPGYDCKRWIGK